MRPTESMVWISVRVNVMSYGSGADNGATATPRDDDRLAPQLGIVPLFDRRVKRIHVDMNDLANRHRPSS